MNTELAHDAALPKPYAPAILPLAQPVGTGKWFARIVAWLAVAALYVLTLKCDVHLMHWRFDVMPEGPRGMLKQVLYGFRDFGQFLPIVVALVIVLRMDRRRWTIVPAIIIAQILAGAAYNTGKMTIARYRPHQAIKQVLAASPDPVPDLQKDAHALSKMKVQQTWIGWRPGNDDEATQSFPSGHSRACVVLSEVDCNVLDLGRGLCRLALPGCRALVERLRGRGDHRIRSRMAELASASLVGTVTPITP
jgi:hypothetical protein